MNLGLYALGQNLIDVVKCGVIVCLLDMSGDHSLKVLNVFERFGVFLDILIGGVELLSFIKLLFGYLKLSKRQVAFEKSLEGSWKQRIHFQCLLAIFYSSLEFLHLNVGKSTIRVVGGFSRVQLCRIRGDMCAYLWLQCKV